MRLLSRTHFVLTTEQQQLVEKNLPLVGKLMRRLCVRVYLRILGREDAYQVARIALCRAAVSWKPAKGAFGTYAGWWVWGMLQAACTSPGITLMRDPGWRTSDGSVGFGETVTLPDRDTIPDPHGQPSPAETATNRDEIARLMSNLRPIERRVVTLVADGFNFTEIGQTLGVSKQRATQIYDDAVMINAGRMRQNKQTYKRRDAA